ncbi:MAG: hypothetical protein NTV73_14550 [Hyphomicrobiales bacterium]|nr:hypothetical protein [Hyphomicrobiales bacterium]
MKRIVLILVASIAAASAFADDLPGVVAPKPIVQPMPEPEDQPAHQHDDAIRVGDWDVNVSGSVAVDIGAGSAGRPLR